MKIPAVNKNVLLAVTMLTSFFNPFMSTSVNIALKQIGAEFSMSAVGLSWVSMIFLLSSAVFLVPFGKLADIYGRRRIFLYGTIVFTAASLLCGLAFSEQSLILFRFIQGIGSAMVFSTSMAIVISEFPPKERGKVIGLNVSAVYLGLTMAPVIGGIMTQYLGWRSLFYVNTVAGILITIGIITKIKSEWAEAKGELFEWQGSLVYMVSISSLMFGFSKLPEPFAIGLTIFGLAGFIVFVVIELKVEFPVLNISLFRDNRIFAFSNLAALINYAATFAVTFMLSLYLQYVKGLQPRDAGILLITQPAFMAIVASFSGRMSDRYDSRILASLGMSIIVVGLLFLCFLNVNSSNIYLISGLVVLGIGFGLFSSPNTNAVMSSVEKRYLGIASATIGTMRLSGQMISMAIAAMAIHVFIGDDTIAFDNFPQFMTSMRIVFIIFTALCVLGVFASLARGKKGVVN
jgi:EmrB/QacA subfamily drug resistance transporter